MTGPGRSYLRFTACAVFLALGAYAIAHFAQSALRPDTVTASMVTVSETVPAEGAILRDELCVCAESGSGEYAVSDGERVRAGELIMTDGKDGLYAPCAGFFCSGVDGWESLSPYALDASPDFPENAVGRIVRGGWFFVTEPEDSGSFYAGQTLTLTLDGVGSYPAVCCGKNGGAVVLRCREGLEDVLSLRFVKASLSPGGATGYKLPASAVGKDENGEFVYVLKAGIPKRAQVKTVCAKDGFCLVQSAAFGSGAEILTKHDES